MGVRGQEAVLDSSYANGYYLERLTEFKEEPPRKADIVFIGNSITEAGNWSEIISFDGFANRGISGDNSYGVLARLDEALSLGPKKLFLMIGVNDLKRGTPHESIFRNHRRIAQKVRDQYPQVDLYIQSVLPVREPKPAEYYLKITNEKIDAINRGLRQIASDYGFQFVDLHKEVFSDEEGLLYERFTTDGLHLSKEGYEAWIEHLTIKGYL